MWEIIDAINAAINNIQFPFGDEAPLNAMAATFEGFAGDRLSGTVGACDGIVLKMERPRREDVGGDVASFWTRKGFYAYGLQAVCDGTCKFRYATAVTSAASHDSVSYDVSSMHKNIAEKRLPPWAHLVMDHAYVCTEQELSPYHQPRSKALSVWEDAFNYFLSLNRQCIERAFGLWVGTWGIFWRPLRVGARRIPSIVSATMKLHNIRVDRFGATHTGIAIGDSRSADHAEVLFGGGSVNAGFRSDLVTSVRRKQLTEMLESRCVRRPPNKYTSYIDRTNRHAPHPDQEEAWRVFGTANGQDGEEY